MTERETVVLYGAYERAFLSKAIIEGYVKPFDPQDLGLEPESLEPEWLLRFDYERIYKHNPFKSAVLQMFLLFDKVILMDPIIPVDFSRMEDTGFIEVVTMDKEPALLGYLEWDWATNEYAMFLKPIVLNALVTHQHPEEKRILRSHGLYPRIFFSAVYDSLFLQKPEPIPEKVLSKIFRFLQIDEKKYVLKNKSVWEAPDKSRKYARMYWGLEVCGTVGKLMKLLELSVLKNAVLMQNEFSMSGLELDSSIWEKADQKRLMESYQILRLSFERLIGTLPHLHSLEDVLCLKDKRHRDIRRLRSVLSEIENALREGKKRALNKAEKEVRQASLDLSRGNRLEKVSRWTTYLSLPLGIIEACFGLPPIAGLTTGFVGTATTISNEVAKAKNGWLQIVR